MRKGLLIYEEMRKYLVIYEEAVSHMWLCYRSLQDILIYDDNFVFFFISVLACQLVCRRPVVWPQPHPSSHPCFQISGTKSYADTVTLYSTSVLGIRIRIHRIRMVLGLPDPDPLVRGTNPESGSGPRIRNPAPDLGSFPFLINVLTGLK